MPERSAPSRPEEPQEIDPGRFSAAVSAITSAFGDPTRRRIYLFAREHDAGVTAAEVAEAFGLHPNVARHHLDKLAAGGHVDVVVARPDGGVGRPAKHYVTRPSGLDLAAPVRRDDLLLALLGRALTELGDERAQRLAEEVGEGYGRALAAGMAPAEGQRSFRAALHAVAEALTAHGFAARAEDGGDGAIRLVSEQCPFGETAVAHPVVCAVDRGMVRGMLGSLYGQSRADLAASRPRGDDVCVTSVLPRSRARAAVTSGSGPSGSGDAA